MLLWASSHSVMHVSSASIICIIRRSSPFSTTWILLYLSEILSLNSAAEVYKINALIDKQEWLPSFKKVKQFKSVTSVFAVPLFVYTVTPGL